MQIIDRLLIAVHTPRPVADLDINLIIIIISGSKKLMSPKGEYSFAQTAKIFGLRPLPVHCQVGDLAYW